MRTKILIIAYVLLMVVFGSGLSMCVHKAAKEIDQNGGVKVLVERVWEGKNG